MMPINNVISRLTLHTEEKEKGRVNSCQKDRGRQLAGTLE